MCPLELESILRNKSNSAGPTLIAQSRLPFSNALLKDIYSGAMVGFIPSKAR